MLLGCIADDFTGATDLANNLVRGGMRVVQTIGVPREPLAGEVDAVVVALKSRTPTCCVRMRLPRCRRCVDTAPSCPAAVHSQQIHKSLIIFIIMDRLMRSIRSGWRPARMK